MTRTARPLAGWFPALAAPVPGRPRLICFSYAGGGPSVYHAWARHLGEHVQVVPVLLPGRGTRLRESPYTAMRPLVDDVATAIVECALAADYALFGHSMGALVAYEVGCELRRRGAGEPRHLFIAGSRAPHQYGDPAAPLLPDDDLRRAVRDLGGLGADEEIGDVYLTRRLPALRADLDVCRTYRWTPRPPLNCPVTAYGASDDPLASPAQVDAWRDYTVGSFLRRRLTGGHFFHLGPAQAALLADLRREMDRLATAAPA